MNIHETVSHYPKVLERTTKKITNNISESKYSLIF